VNSRLDRVKDWSVVVRNGRFQLRLIAQILKSSERNLRRYIWKRFKKRPKQWLDELRAQSAREDFARGELVKTTSNGVYFKHACNFSRFYKRVTGSSPRNDMIKSAVSAIDTKCPK
jgi:AraC-like DNA-binding protein